MGEHEIAELADGDENRCSYTVHANGDWGDYRCELKVEHFGPHAIGLRHHAMPLVNALEAELADHKRVGAELLDERDEIIAGVQADNATLHTYYRKYLVQCFEASGHIYDPEHTNAGDVALVVGREFRVLRKRVEWLENDRRELAAMLDFYLTDESDEGWGLQTKTTRNAFRAVALPEATAAFGMWEEDTALATEEDS